MAQLRVAEGRSAVKLLRLTVYATVAALVCAVIMGLFLRTMPVALANLLHIVFATSFYAIVSWRYFRDSRRYPPIPVAATFTITSALVDVILAVVAHEHHFLDLAGLWVGLGFVFFSTCVTSVLLGAQIWRARS